MGVGTECIQAQSTGEHTGNRRCHMRHRDYTIQNSSLLLADGNRAPPPGRGAYTVEHRYYESSINPALGELRFQSWVTNWVGTQRVVSRLLDKEMELKTMVLRDERRVIQTERPNALRSHVYTFNKGAPSPRTPLTFKTCLRNWQWEVNECL